MWTPDNEVDFINGSTGTVDDPEGSIAEERTKMLDAKERDAAKEKELASKGAKEAAAEAQRLAAQAAARAKVAVKAGRAAQVRPRSPCLCAPWLVSHGTGRLRHDGPV